MKDSPIILAVDTSSEFGSVAVRRGGQTVSEVHLQSSDGFAHLIFGAIQEALSKGGVALSEVECFAAGSGPGSFTGVRVALSAVKGLASALSRPAAGISNLRALSTFGRSLLRAAVMDARRGEVYGGVYDAQAHLIAPEIVAPWNTWAATLPQGVELLGVAGGPCLAKGVPFTVVQLYLAAAVARCAELDGPTRWQHPAELDANYVRRSDAELFWKDS